MNSVTFENLPELPFAAAESINQLRVNLSLCGKEIKTVMVTSCEPNEGKSFICLNLARSMAASGARVLLIDCDLRNSTYRRKYNLCPGGARIPGMADVLAGRAGLQDVIYRTNIAHAYILPVTSTLPNPSFLLENGVLDQIIAQCREIYDYIIVDTPPALTVADALKIAPMCDGSMIVVRGGVTDRKEVAECYHFVNRASKSFLGFVLNSVDMGEKSKSYYSRRYGYGYYGKAYGYGYGSSGSKNQK